MKSLLRFIFSHSIFIACCAVAMCLETFLVFKADPSFDIILLVFLSTIGSYNFYWLISKWNFSKNKRTFLSSKENLAYLILLGIATLGLLYNYELLIELWLPISITALLTLLYCLPLIGIPRIKVVKGAGFIKTFLLAFTWAVVTVVLPLWQSQAIDAAMMMFLLNRFAFVLLLCILFDMRDVKLDKQLSIYSIATDFSLPAVKKLWWLVLACFVASAMALFYFINSFSFIVSHLITSLALITIYKMAIGKKRGYYFYYFLVDGLMIASYFFSLFSHSFYF